MTAGVVRRVNGPVVEVELPGLAMADLIEVGRSDLPAEVVALRGDHATAQAYEYTGALAPGDPARPLGRPLSVRLGPGLTGQVFDGLLRPLGRAGTWLEAGAGRSSSGRGWTFEPRAEPGQVLETGALLGEISDAGPVAHRVLVRRGVAG